jgi:hypothetical protein
MVLSYSSSDRYAPGAAAGGVDWSVATAVVFAGVSGVAACAVAALVASATLVSEPEPVEAEPQPARAKDTATATAGIRIERFMGQSNDDSSAVAKSPAQIVRTP